MTRFNYIIKHLAGNKNVLADTLSRQPDLTPEGKDNKNLVAIPEEKSINFLMEELRKNITEKKPKIVPLE
jgi:hypothetical protein